MISPPSQQCWGFQLSDSRLSYRKQQASLPVFFLINKLLSVKHQESNPNPRPLQRFAFNSLRRNDQSSGSAGLTNPGPVADYEHKVQGVHSLVARGIIKVWRHHLKVFLLHFVLYKFLLLSVFQQRRSSKFCQLPGFKIPVFWWSMHLNSLSQFNRKSASILCYVGGPRTLALLLHKNRLRPWERPRLMIISRRTSSKSLNLSCVPWG